MKPNKHNTCETPGYCFVNRTALRQAGDGRKMVCPVCGAVYDPDWDKEPESRRLQKYKERMAQKYGWPIK